MQQIFESVSEDFRASDLFVALAEALAKAGFKLEGPL